MHKIIQKVLFYVLVASFFVSPLFGQGEVSINVNTKTAYLETNQTISLAVTVVSKSDFNQQVFLSLSCSSLNSSNFNYSFSPSVLNHPYTNGSILSVSVSKYAPLGNHLLLIKGSNGPLEVFDTCQLILEEPDCNWSKIFNTAPKSITTDNNNVLWAAGNSLSRFDGNDFSTYTRSNSNLPGPLSGIAVDKYNNKWMISKDAVSLVKFDDTFWTIYDRSNSSIPSQITTLEDKLLSDKNDYKWIFSNAGLVKIYKNTWTLYDNRNSNIPIGAVTDIALDSANNIWLSYSKNYNPNNYCLSKFDNQRWTHYTSASTCTQYPHGIKKIYFDKSNALWIVPYTENHQDTLPILTKWDFKNFELWYSENHQPFNHFIINDNCDIVSQDNSSRIVPEARTVVDLVEDKYKNIWFTLKSVSSGLGIYRFNENNWIQFTSQNSSLPDNNTSLLSTDQEGEMYALSGYELVKYNCSQVVTSSFSAENEKRLKIYPGKNKDEFIIDSEGINYLNTSNIILCDLSGRRKETIIKTANNSKLVLNCPNLNAGLYLLQIENNGTMMNLKFLVE